MGRFFLSNNNAWLEDLSKSQSIAGMRQNNNVPDGAPLLCYHKYRVDNENFYIDPESSDFIVSSGSLIYKDSFGLIALKELLSDFKREKLKDIRKQLVGNFSIAISVGDRISVFVDETGTYSLYYYFDNNARKYLITNTFYHIQKCAQQKLKGVEFLEYATIPSIFDNQSPFENITRLGPDELIILSSGDLYVEKVELNKYSLPQPATFESTLESIGTGMVMYSKAVAKIPYQRMLFLTGGVDSRLLLAAHMNVQSDIVIGNWQGHSFDMYSQSEDELISRSLAKKCNVDFKIFDVTHNINEDIDKSFNEALERYGEYTAIYGNNRKWFEIFENGPHVYWDFGHIGEVFRDIEGMEDLYHDNLSLKEFYYVFLKQQCSNFEFKSNGEISPDYFDNCLYSKFQDYCLTNGINPDSLKLKDCFRLHNAQLVHSDMIKANMYNINGFYTNIYSQKEIFDYSIDIEPKYRTGKRLIVSLINKLYPKLNEVEYFTRCRFMKYNLSSHSLSEVFSTNVKEAIKKCLYRSKIGNSFLDARSRRISTTINEANKDLITLCVGRINSSKVMSQLEASVDENSCEYTPNYINFCRSCQYMDKIII